MREGQADRNRKQQPHRTCTRRDQIEYIADLVLELREMARSHHLPTLAGILDLAHAEARLRAKDYAD